MARAICRCGQPLSVPKNSSERVVCPSCGAKVRIRRPKAQAQATAPVAADGYIRFFCPCGRRLKVSVENPPEFGKCPDCGEVVPVPKLAPDAQGNLPPGHPETPTAELKTEDLATLERWTRDHLARAANAAEAPSTSHFSGPAPMPEHPERVEVGLRVCPRCRRPVHLSAEVCRACGSPVPKR